MNFLGHAWIALSHSADPAFVLGSMLPDFAGMARAPLAADQPHDRVRDGVALHHRTDDAFHRHPAFVGLVERVTRELGERGVGRGTARAVGHIGVEMLLDGELLDHVHLRDAYTTALNVAPGLPLRFRADDHDERFRSLTRRLVVFGVPWDYRLPQAVTLRLSRTLSGRPRLCPQPDDHVSIEAVLRQVQPSVSEAAQALLAAVRAACAPHPHSP